MYMLLRYMYPLTVTKVFTIFLFFNFLISVSL